MAIVCKAMLIRRGRKRAGADFAALPDAVGFFFATGIVSSLFFSSSAVVRGPSVESRFPAVAPLFYAPCAPLRLLHLSAHFQLVIRLLPFVLSIYLRIVFIARRNLI